jgi:hypothetical protein
MYATPPAIPHAAIPYATQGIPINKRTITPYTTMLGGEG